MSTQWISAFISILVIILLELQTFSSQAIKWRNNHTSYLLGPVPKHPSILWVIYFFFSVFILYFLFHNNYSLFNPKGNQPRIFIGRTDAEAPILWPPDGKSQLTGKDPDAGKEWRQEEKGVTEGEMVGWHHWLHGHEFEQAPGDGEGQGSLAYCSPCSGKELDMTEWLNWTELDYPMRIWAPGGRVCIAHSITSAARNIADTSVSQAWLTVHIPRKPVIW